MEKHEKQRFKKGILFATLIILIFAAVTNLNSIEKFILSAFSILSPLLGGVLLALILGTPMRMFERLFRLINKKIKSKRKIPGKVITLICLILTYTLAVVAVGFVIGILIPALTDSIREIATAIKAVIPTVYAFLEKNGINTETIRELVALVNFSAIFDTLTSNAGNILSTVMNSVNGVITVVANLVTTVIFSIYLLSNKNKLRSQSDKLITAYCSEKKAEKAKYVLNLTVSTFSKFFSGQCLEAIILGSICFIVMTIAGFPYAPVIATVIGITAFIPYVGAFIGGALGVLLILIESPMKAVIFVIVFIIIQQLENNLIYPRVVGTSIGLPAMWTFAALIVGGALYGVAGMLIFIPATSILYTVIRNDVYARLKAKAKKEEEMKAQQENDESADDSI